MGNLQFPTYNSICFTSLKQGKIARNGVIIRIEKDK
jgi:hypothetical protein